MGQQETEHEGTESEADPGSRKRKPKYVLKSHVDLASVALGAVATLSLWLAAQCRSLHSSVPLVEFALAGVTAFGLIFHLQYRYRFRRKRKLAAWPPSIAIALWLVLVSHAVWVWVRYAPTAPMPFRIELETALYATGRPDLAPTMGEPPRAFENDPRVMTPIHVVAFLTFTNTQSPPATVSRFWLEGGPTADGPWVKLVHINQQAAWKFYRIDSGDLTRALPIEFGESLDRALTDARLRPGDTRKGWTTWQCPVPNCPGEFLRIVVRDTAGRDSSRVFSLDPNEKPENGADLVKKQFFVSLPSRNIGGLRVVFMPHAAPEDSN